MSRTYKEAIQFDDELMRLSEAMMNASTSNKMASLQRALEARHLEIQREIEEEEASEKSKALQEKYDSNPALNAFRAFVAWQGVSSFVVDFYGKLFFDPEELKDQSHKTKEKMAAYLEGFTQDLNQDDLKKYSDVIEKVRKTIGNIKPQELNQFFEFEGDGSQNEDTLFSLATEFLEAARLLQATPPTRIVVSSPIYYLLGHSAELMLKAFLFKRGVSIKELFQFQHDLRRLVESAYKHGMSENVSLQRVLELADTYKGKAFEYRTRSGKTFPSLDQLTEEIECLEAAVYDVLSLEEWNSPVAK